jgi:SHS2 domain-containing protein
LRLSIRAPDLAGILAEAGRALAELEMGGTPPAPAGGWTDISVRSADRAALVVDWLNELIYRAEVDRWVPAEFEIQRITDTRVRARARGIAVQQAPAAVKAATLHGVRVEAIPGGMEADVVLDV